MALCYHSDETLADIQDDLKEIQDEIGKLRKKMTEAGVTELGFDGEKGQVTGRTALHRFISDGRERLRSLKADKYLQKREFAESAKRTNVG